MTYHNCLKKEPLCVPRGSITKTSLTRCCQLTTCSTSQLGVGLARALHDSYHGMKPLVEVTVEGLSKAGVTHARTVQGLGLST